MLPNIIFNHVDQTQATSCMYDAGYLQVGPGSDCQAHDYNICHPPDALHPCEGPDPTLNGALAEGTMHADPAADDSELGSQPAYAPSDQGVEEEDMSDMALEDAIMAAHYGMADQAADGLPPDLLDLGHTPAAADAEDFSSQLDGQQASYADLSADQQGLGSDDLPGLRQSAGHAPAKVSEMTFLAQLRPAGNAENSPLGSEDEDLQPNVSTADGALESTQHGFPADPELDHSSSPAGGMFSKDSSQSKPGQVDDEIQPDEAVRIAAWQAYWQSQYKAGAFQPPPQGPPGLALSSLHTVSDLQASVSTTAAALSAEHDPARHPGNDVTSMSPGHSVEHTADASDPGQEPGRLREDLSHASAGGAAAPSSLQGDAKEGQPGLQSPAASAWQPWLEWWHGIAGTEPAIAENTTAEANAPDTFTTSGTIADDQASPPEPSRLSLQPGQATRHVADEDLIAVPISLLRRYQQLEWEEWLRRWQAWQAQQVQPADKTSGNL